MTTPASPTPPSRSATAARRPSWADRNYVLLSAAAVVTGLSNQSALIASAFAVLETGGDSAGVGLVATARTLPFVVFLLIAGAVADRLPRHHVMVAANTLSCLSHAVFGGLVLAGDVRLWQMLLLSALGGTGQAFFFPASQGMLMASVTGEQASRAFAIYRIGVNGAGIGGAALGGALVAVLGSGWVLVVNAAFFAVAGALRSFLSVAPLTAQAPGGGMPAELREGWREFIGRPWLWSIVAQFSLVVAVIDTVEAVYGPLVAKEHLGGPGPWGLAVAGFGAGTVVGGLLMVRWKPRRLLFVATLCVFPLALPSVALAVPVPFGPLTAVMLLSGATTEVFGVLWITTMHQEIPEEMFSRVSSYDYLGSIGLVPLATALAGPAEHTFGRGPTLWGSAALVVLVTGAVLFVPDVRHLARREERWAAVPPKAQDPDQGLDPDPALDPAQGPDVPDGASETLPAGPATAPAPAEERSAEHGRRERLAGSADAGG